MLESTMIALDMKARDGEKLTAGEQERYIRAARYSECAAYFRDDMLVCIVHVATQTFVFHADF